MRTNAARLRFHFFKPPHYRVVRCLDAGTCDRYAGRLMRASSRKLVVGVVALLILAFIVYRSSGMIGLAGFSGAKLLQALGHANLPLLVLSVVAIYVCYAIRALRWKVFQGNLGASRFWPIYSMTLAGFAAVFLLGRAGEPIRPMLLARKEKLPFADMFGIYALERLFDAASTAVIAAVALILFESQAHAGETAGRLAAAARTTGTILFAGVIGAVAFLIYLRVHGTALLERLLQGWIAARGWREKIADILLGFARGIQAIRSWSDFALAVFYSTVHWVLVLLVYLWISHAFGGSLGTLSLGAAMLVMAFTLVGSAVQLPGVGGGSQVASFLAYTAIFGVEKEPAAAVSIALWLITFAACAVVGTPLLLHQGLSLGKLRELAKEEREEADRRLEQGNVGRDNPMEGTVRRDAE
jgi:glycosyltransferase 2 family protein